jgi:2-succinyl-5-enolpyruvyl-6-hydroxy-3-cyclohexene-1-carboxylate synthase
LANYHPAVLEAHHSAIPLLVLSADRPARLRKTGSNQTTDQVGIFGSAVTFSADVSESSFNLISYLDEISSGPSHINLQFDEPLLSDESTDWLANRSENNAQAKRVVAEEITVKEERAVVIVGHDRAGFSVSEIKNFISATQLPFIAEDPLSFPDAQAHASLYLGSEKNRKKLHCKQVIIIGRTTLSRSINALIAESEFITVIDPRTTTIDSLRTANEIFTSLPLIKKRLEDHEWLQLWSGTSVASEKVIAGIDDWQEGMIARAIAAGLPEAPLYISSSRPIRDLEGFAKPRSGITTYANRGLAGIDGNISTAAGIAHVHSGATAIIGDLAFLHDMSGLLTARKVKLRIFVIDNNGGGIFSTLPQANVAGFEDIFGTPQDVNLMALAKSFTSDVVEVSNYQELNREIVKPISALSVVIVKVPARNKSAEFLKETIAKLASL